MALERFPMNSKKANWIFLITIVLYITASYVIVFAFPQVAESARANILLAEAVILLPVLITALLSGEKLPQFLGFHKMKISSLFMILLFTILTQPAITLPNLISQIWVENTAVEMMSGFFAGNQSFLGLFFPMAVLAPLCEEMTCRGAYYGSYKRSGRNLGAALLSAAVFAVIHLNFNQAGYAFVMGILAVLLVEATGSLWSSVLYHGLINGSQVILMYTILNNNEDFYAQQMEMITTDTMLYTIGAYLVLTAVTLPLAWAVLVWIGKNQGRSVEFQMLWKRSKQKKDKLITLPVILGLVLCVLVMTGILQLLIGSLLQRF